MEIRKSIENDKESIRKLHLDTFNGSEGKMVSQLAIELLEDKTALPILSLVVEQDDEIIGNIIFSSIKIEGAEDVCAYILAPLAVSKLAQRSGTGTQLITKGLEILTRRGAKIVLVYGDPQYYQRTGFKAGHKLKPPYKLQYSDEAWMAQELIENILNKTKGKVRCALSLNSPKYW